MKENGELGNEKGVLGKCLYNTETDNSVAEPIEAGEKDVKYLIRRMNIHGQWEHLKTITFKPLLMSWETFLRSRFGPGRYNIATVEDGVPGMRNFASFNIGYDIEYLGWVPEMPSEDYISIHYGGGDYLIGKFTEIQPFAIVRDVHGEPVWDILNQGVRAISSGYVIFRVVGIPPK